MADPWTIVGSASAILTFVEFAGKCVKTAKSLHESASGSTEDNSRFENVVTKMQNLIDGVKAERAEAPASEAEIGLFAVANECESLGRAILKLLHRTSRKAESSLRETIRASVSTVWNEKEVEDLQDQLQRCMTHLNIQMLAIMRSETGHRLEQILSMQSSHSKNVDSVQGLVKDLSANQADNHDILISLHRMFGATDTILTQINQQRIIDALRVSGMKHRYDQVSDAAHGTFNWLIQSSELPDHPELTVPLSTWLSEGNGIFHISGKPGSGKSTLMKLVAESESTASRLAAWAGEEKLIKASVFIWKYGDPVQRTVAGVVRSLLCSILTELPDLFPKVLPKYWEPRQYSPWLSTPDLHVTPKDVLQAFERCIDPSGPAQHVRICLLLDGLDELNDPEELHTSFALRLMKWSNENPKRLKICVTSREENAFMNNFPAQQRLRLHRVTNGDVRQLVTTRLNEHPRFRTFTEKDRDIFCSQITERSLGVFLWVKLVLDEIYENLDQQRSLGALQKALDQVPEELEGFFFKIFNSIRKVDQKEAYCMFLLALEFQYAPALVYSFVEDVLALEMGDSHIDDRAMTLEDIEVRHTNFSARLRGLNRGLLEITEPKSLYSDQYERDPHTVLAFGSRVSTVHRSVNDWLLHSMPDTLRQFRDIFEKEEAFLKCVIRHAQLVPWMEWSSRRWYGLLRRLITSMSQSPALHTKKSIRMAQLGNLEDVLQEKLSKNGDSHNSRDFGHEDSSNTGASGVNQVSLLYQSCELYFAPFVDWGLRNLAWAQDPQARVELLNVVCRFGHDGDWSRPHDFESCLDVFFKFGVNPNSDYGRQRHSKTTPWLTFLFHKMRRDLLFEFGHDSNPGMKALLQADADPRVFLVLRAGQKFGFKVIWDPGYLHHTISFGSGFSEHAIQLMEFNPNYERPRWGKGVLGEIEYLRKIKDWPLHQEIEDSLRITLREFVEAGLNEHAGTLLPLIDRNLARREPSGHTVVDEASTTLQSEDPCTEYQDKGSGDEAKVNEEDASDEVVANETWLSLFDAWKLPFVFLILDKSQLIIVYILLSTEHEDNSRVELKLRFRAWVRAESPSWDIDNAPGGHGLRIQVDEGALRSLLNKPDKPMGPTTRVVLDVGVVNTVRGCVDAPLSEEATDEFDGAVDEDWMAMAASMISPHFYNDLDDDRA
ncbi:p-loop containing nucleoside triphosphate hydrolase, partial [Colletotrichum incanum]